MATDRTGDDSVANGGWYGTKEEWAQIEKPLITLDPVIKEFAMRAGLTVTKNLKDWPERSMRWGSEISCLIQIYLADKDALTWNIWLCCTRDIQGERFWRREFLVEKRPIEVFQDRLPKLLWVGHERLIDWSNHPETLEFATKLGTWTPRSE
jgi:hypothetical protein